MKTEFDRIFSQGLEFLDLELSSSVRNAFFIFYQLLIEKNKVMNLTAITDLSQVIYKHFIDSLSLVKLGTWILPDQAQVLDLGTGAGFPGIPLAPVFPQVEFTLVDSLQKRIHFIEESVEKLEIKNIRCCHGRAEDLGREKNYRESFDLCLSRAVANLSTLSEYCLPFVKIGGDFISFKALTASQELEDAKKAMDLLGGSFFRKEDFMLPEGSERSLIQIKKIQNTPGRYPRKAGVPSKSPLGS